MHMATSHSTQIQILPTDARDSFSLFVRARCGRTNVQVCACAYVRVLRYMQACSQRRIRNRFMCGLMFIWGKTPTFSYIPS